MKVSIRLHCRRSESETPMKFLPLVALCALVTAARAEDGYDLWLRYQPLEKQALASYRGVATEVVSAGHSAAVEATRDELTRGLSGLLARKVAADDTIRRDGAILFGTPVNSRTIASLKLPLEGLGPEGYVIRSVTAKGHRVIVVAGNSDVGVLYGAFRLLRQIQTRQPLGKLDIVSAPAIKLRMLNHWDNLDGVVERGYAGASIFNWWELPDHVSQRMTDYARADASIGINGTVLTNVNASALVLTEEYLHKVAALADAFRPYGIKVYLTARFSSPMEIGGLKTGDPLDPGVREWWNNKADEIYKYVPDFGGFLVKANSEGQPGPQDYGRNHADGANMLADALAPHGGVVIWRAFVYSNTVPDDRIKQAYSEFKPLDGAFRNNVVVQVKNGPLDFQPREPFSPLFGATPKTNTGLEVEITKEYLGFETHLVYLGTMWQEVLEADTFQKGPGSTVAKVIDGSLNGNKLTEMAGVSNIGADRNWTGSIFDQANWYAFGRLAWNPNDSAETIANDWVKMTFTANPAFVKPVVAMMMGSRETAVDTMTPLGLTHLMGTSHHYGPGPWVDDAGRADWNPVYFHRADKLGIGFDRTPTGSNAVAQYAPPLAEEFSNVATTPEKYLLWFHHVPWTATTKSGRTLWDELVTRYTQGVDNVAAMEATWGKLRLYVDAQRFNLTNDLLRIQARDATLWRDACIAYFRSISGLPLPAGMAPPAHDLAYYQDLYFPYAPGQATKNRPAARPKPAATASTK
jgi:alpha-glucuronidase